MQTILLGYFLVALHFPGLKQNVTAMQMYSEAAGIGNLILEIEVQKNQDKFSTHCVAKTATGFVVWTNAVTTEDGELKLYDSPTEALEDGRKTYGPSQDEIDFYRLAFKQIDANKYFLSLT